MEKIVEALSKLLPEDQISEVANAVKSELDTAKTDLEAEFNTKLEEAYAQLSGELKEGEKTAYKGYEEAYTLIQELRNRLEMQRAEAEAALKEGYEEAYQMLLAEKQKNENIEVDMYEKFNEKLQEMHNYFVEKIHQFLEYKGKDIYEQAKRDVLNDPRMAEHKVTLNKIVENVSDYLSDEDYNSVCNSKLNDACKSVEELKGQVRTLSARNIRMSSENDKLTEAVRQYQQMINEATEETTTNNKKERIEEAKQATGKGKSANVDKEQIIGEWKNNEVKIEKSNADKTLVESMDADALNSMRVLAGTSKTE
jgi:hypothetical protein